MDLTVARVTWAARAGAHLVQVRERDLEGGALVSLVRRCVEAVRGSRARVLVNDRLDVALAAGAHGVHLRADSMPAARVRAVCPPGFLVGRSVHAPDEAVRVESEGGLDYLIFGTLFPTVSKPGRQTAGLEALAGLVRAVRLPVLAVGGIAADNLGDVGATGAAGYAAIGMFVRESEPAVSQELRRAAAAFGGRAR
jgi:thiamine-phosphate diphosphorylase